MGLKLLKREEEQEKKIVNSKHLTIITYPVHIYFSILERYTFKLGRFCVVYFSAVFQFFIDNYIGVRRLGNRIMKMN